MNAPLVRMLIAVGAALVAVWWFLANQLSHSSEWHLIPAEEDTRVNRLTIIERPYHAGDRLVIDPAKHHDHVPMIELKVPNPAADWRLGDLVASANDQLSDDPAFLALIADDYLLPLSKTWHSLTLFDGVSDEYRGEVRVQLEGSTSNAGSADWAAHAQGRRLVDGKASSRFLRKATQYALTVYLILLLAFAVTGSQLRGLLRAPTGGRTRWRHWLVGLAVGMLGLAAYMTLLTLIGERAFEARAPAKVLGDVFRYLAAAPAVNLLQDVLFFGLIFALTGHRVVATGAIFGLAHYVKIDPAVHFDDIGGSLPFSEAMSQAGRLVSHLVDGFAEIPEAPGRLLGIVLLGCVLADVRRRGSLWLCMGLHAGWYVTRSVGRKISDDVEGDHEWLFGTDAFHDGLFGLVMIVASWAVLVRPWRRPAEPRSGRRPPE